MATNTLIQYLDTGSSDVSNRREVETFIANGDITAADALCFDFAAVDVDKRALLVKRLDSAAAANTCFVGVALNDAKAGEKVDVVIKGLALANVVGTTVQGSTLEASATKGQLGLYVNTSLAPIAGVATEADTANKAWIIVKKQF
jgi:hypothetical protein